MKLKTSLQLSAIFPIIFAIAVVLMLRWHLWRGGESPLLDVSFMALFGLVGITMAAVIISYSRDILKKIDTLSRWSNAVLQGDLNHNIGLDPSNDEVGRLSMALSKMLKELKEAYAAMHKESGRNKVEAIQYKKVADVSQIATQHLSRALATLKDSQDDLLQQERLRALEQVIRVTSHDLCDALTPIVGTCDYLTSHPDALNDKDAALSHVKIIRDSAGGLRKSLLNLAGLFRTTADSEGPTDANYAVEEAIKLANTYRNKLEDAKGRKIDIRTQLNVVPAVAVDVDDLEDAIVRLMLNAIEAMPEGGVLTITTQSDSASVSINVRDTGKGMPEEIQKRCLDPFFTTKQGVVAGRGLTMVNGLARRTGGVLEIQSKPNMGTWVRIGFPIWTKKPKEADEPLVEGQDQGALHILLVDDEVAVRDVVAMLLRKANHLVETAASGAEGLEKMKSQKFDVAIIDRVMPGMCGDDLAKGIGQVSKETGIMMLTALGDIMLQEKDIPAHIDVLVTKPVTLKELCNGVQKAMKSAKNRQISADLKSDAAMAGAPRAPGRKKDSEGQTSKGQTFSWIN